MKYVLVTGAYGGMGKAVVKKLIDNGYTVFALDKVVENGNERVIPIETDLTNVDSIKNAFNKVTAVTKNLYGIIHFAGIYMLDSLIEIENNDFERIFKVNFFSAFYINKIFMPLMKQGCRIIMTTSELAPLNPLPFTGVYAITKSTLDKYAFSLKMELQLVGVHVSVLRAGAVSTKMLGVSTDALDKFCEKTTNYKCNAKRFKMIVNSIESKSVLPEKIAEKTFKILQKKKPKFKYSINRNKLLLLLNILPIRLQFWIIKNVLKNS